MPRFAVRDERRRHRRSGRVAIARHTLARIQLAGNSPLSVARVKHDAERLHREQTVEECVVPLECHSKMLRRDVVAAIPLTFQSRSLVREHICQAFHDVSDKQSFAGIALVYLALRCS